MPWAEPKLRRQAEPRAAPASLQHTRAQEFADAPTEDSVSGGASTRDALSEHVDGGAPIGAAMF